MSAYQDIPEGPCEKVSGQSRVTSSKKAWGSQVRTAAAAWAQVGWPMLGGGSEARNHCPSPGQGRTMEQGKFWNLRGGLGQTVDLRKVWERDKGQGRNLGALPGAMGYV